MKKVAKLYSKIKTTLAREAGIRQLRGMSNRELADIGISRGEIRYRATNG